MNDPVTRHVVGGDDLCSVDTKALQDNSVQGHTIQVCCNTFISSFKLSLPILSSAFSLSLRSLPCFFSLCPFSALLSLCPFSTLLSHSFFPSCPFSPLLSVSPSLFLYLSAPSLPCQLTIGNSLKNCYIAIHLDT